MLSVPQGELDADSAAAIAQYGVDYAAGMGIDAAVQPPPAAAGVSKAILDVASEQADIVAMGSLRLPLSDPHRVSFARTIVRRAMTPVLIVPAIYEPYPVDAVEQSSALAVTIGPSAIEWLPAAAELCALASMTIATVGWHPSDDELGQLRDAVAGTGRIARSAIEHLPARDDDEAIEAVMRYVIAHRDVGAILVPRRVGKPITRPTLAELVAACVAVPVLTIPTSDRVVDAAE